MQRKTSKKITGEMSYRILEKCLKNTYENFKKYPWGLFKRIPRQFSEGMPERIYNGFRKKKL